MKKSLVSYMAFKEKYDKYLLAVLLNLINYKL
jgi:hypothetical protein